jgi:small subunit ribosomal protein S16
LLKIRLARIGKKKQPTYRVVIADARAPRDGKYVEIVGSYNPRMEPTTFVIDEDKVKDWLHKGAQPTMIMHKLLAKQGLMAAPTFPPPKPKAAPPAPAARPAATPAAAAPAAATAVAEPEAPAEEPATAEPEAEEPVATEEPAAEEPAPEVPAAEEPAAEEAAAAGEDEAKADA